MSKRKREAAKRTEQEEKKAEDAVTNHPLLATDGFVSDGSYSNRQRVLVLASRGITARYRHLLEDVKKMIPHHKKDVKLDTKGDIHAINEIAEMKGCNNCIYFECRKKMDLYMWFSKTPAGPSIKFHVLNVHTMDELKLTGNAMMGSRALLSFDDAFESAAHWRLMKQLLMDCFNTPRGHPKSKPFIDRVMAFYIADNKIWIRNYQIEDHTQTSKALHQAKAAGKDPRSLIEVGPRFVLVPIRMFGGSFGGPTLYMNPLYVSPNLQRAQAKRLRGEKYKNRMEDNEARAAKNEAAVMPRNEVDEVFR